MSRVFEQTKRLEEDLLSPIKHSSLADLNLQGKRNYKPTLHIPGIHKEIGSEIRREAIFT